MKGKRVQDSWCLFNFAQPYLSAGFLSIIFLIYSKKAIHSAATALLQKVNQKDFENPSILSFRAAARNLLRQDSSSLSFLGMTVAEGFGINTYII